MNTYNRHFFNDLSAMLIQRKTTLCGYRDKLLLSLSKAPEGNLEVRLIKGVPRYYHANAAGRPVYLKENDLPLVCQLAQKRYDLKSLKLVSDEIRLYETIISKTRSSHVEDYYESLPAHFRSLISPLVPTDEEFAKEWDSAKYETNPYYASIPELVTEKGEPVKSKSELYIANELFKRSIPYRYECRTFLKDYEEYYPDFTILNVSRRKTIYWEHLGMFDNPGYYDKAVRKINTYGMNDICPGENLILTFESSGVPLNTLLVRKYIEKYCI